MNQLKPSKTSILSSLVFAKKISDHAFFLFLNHWLILLIPAVIAQIFNPIAERAIYIRMSTKEARAEIETQPIIVEVKINKCSV